MISHTHTRAPGRRAGQGVQTTEMYGQSMCCDPKPRQKRAFPHSAGTAPIIAVFIPGTPLHTTPLQKRA